MYLTFRFAKRGDYLLGEYTYDVLGYRTATIMHQDFLAGQELSQGFIDAFEAKGGKSIQRQRIPVGTVDYAPYVTAMQKADCVVCWLLPEETARLLPTYFASGLGMPFIQLHGSFPEVMLQEVGDKGVGIISIHRWCLNLDSPTNKQFVDAYVKKYGVDANYLSTAGYEDMSIILEAIKATGGDTRPEVLDDAIRKVKIDTPSGITSFNQEGVAIGDLHILEAAIMDGKIMWKPIFTYTQVPYLGS